MSLLLAEKNGGVNQPGKIKIVDWDISEFNFIGLYQQHLEYVNGCSDPRHFHEFVPSHRMPSGPTTGTAHTYGHDLLYAIDPAFDQAGYIKARDIGFIRTYRRFVQWLEEEIFCEDLVFQRLPSLRIHYPGYDSNGVMHVDSDFNHPKQEVNLWVPITSSIRTASMMIESECGRADYGPLELKYGQLAIFDSSLTHGNIVNEEGYTRMSFDLRVIPRRIYQDCRGNFSATAIKEFSLGNYYDEF